VTAALQKELGLGAATIVLGAALWWTTAWVLRNALGNLALAGLVSLIAIAWIILCAVTFGMAARALTVLVVSISVGVLAMLAGSFSWGAIGGGVLLALFCLTAWQAIRRDS